MLPEMGKEKNNMKIKQESGKQKAIKIIKQNK